MNAETWLQKAERLQSALAPRDELPRVPPDETTRIKIALWLKREFGDVVEERPVFEDAPSWQSTSRFEC